MSPLDPYLKVSRWIARSEDPFTNFYAVLYEGMKMEGFNVDEQDDETEMQPPYVSIVFFIFMSDY
jgi:hypothetical protein